MIGLSSPTSLYPTQTRIFPTPHLAQFRQGTCPLLPRRLLSV